jgi:type II secretory pathway pseudopilin PulG
MLKRNARRQAGDTLVEVLFAVTVFSLVVVGSLSLMNQGTAASTRSLQITLVRQEIDSQAEALRFLNSSYAAAYYKGYNPDTSDAASNPAEEYFKALTVIRAAGASSVSKFGGDGVTCQTPPARSFILNGRLGTYQPYDASKISPADTFSQVVYAGDNSITTAKGIWIEAVRSTPANGASYTDFHIRACWYPPGTGQSMNLGTIVRLYEPAN